MMKKTNLLKIGIVIVILGMMSFSDCSFADDVSSIDGITDLGLFLKYALVVMQWIWIPIAKMAGELLTNSWVYGEKIGFDVVLRDFWNIMKNLANFTLGFYLIYLIFSNLKNAEKTMDELKGKFIRLLVAGIGIQSSWFLTAVVIDLSTVSLVAAGSLTSQMISEDVNLSTSVQKNNFGNTGMNVTLFPSNGKSSDLVSVEYVPLKNQVTSQSFLDLITPGTGSVEGPLMYLGLMILETHKSPLLKISDLEDLKHSIFNIVIVGGASILYCLEMCVLFFLALLRVFYLWFFIVISPFAVLILCIKNMGKKVEGKGGFAELLTHIDLETFLRNVFKPTIIVLGISITLMFTALMKDFIRIDNHKEYTMTETMKGVTFSSELMNTSNAEGNVANYKTVLDSNLLGVSLKGIGETLMDLLLSLLTVYLIFIILKISIGLGGKKGGFVSKYANKAQGLVGSVVSSIPVMPTGTKDEKGNAQYLTLGHTLGKSFGIGNEDSIVKRIVGKGESKISSYEAEQIASASRLFDDSKSRTTDAKEEQKIKNIIIKERKGLREVAQYVQKIKTESGKGMILGEKAQNKFWKDTFIKWLNDETYNTSNSKEIDIRNAWNKVKKESDDEGLKNLFEDYKAREAYAHIFRLKQIKNVDDLLYADISKL